MRLENYITAGISITQAASRGSCTIGFAPLLCARVRACVRACVRVCMGERRVEENVFLVDI